MTTVETADPPRSAEDAFPGLVNATLLLTAETAGLRAALGLRSEVRALATAPAGRVVLASEDGAALALLAELLEARGSPCRWARRRTCARRTASSPRPPLPVSRADGEQHLRLGDDGGVGARRRPSTAGSSS